MKDDSLSDVQVKAQRQQADADRSKMFEDSAKQSVHGVEVWNAAIEAAARTVSREDKSLAEIVRRLKK